MSKIFDGHEQTLKIITFRLKTSTRFVGQNWLSGKSFIRVFVLLPLWCPLGCILCKHAGGHSVTTSVTSLARVYVVRRSGSLLELSALWTLSNILCFHQSNHQTWYPGSVRMSSVGAYIIHLVHLGGVGHYTDYLIFKQEKIEIIHSVYTWIPLPEMTIHKQGWLFMQIKAFLSKIQKCRKGKQLHGYVSNGTCNTIWEERSVDMENISSWNCLQQTTATYPNE